MMNIGVSTGFFGLAVLGFFLLGLQACDKGSLTPPEGEFIPPPNEVEGVDYFLPKIDLSHWKVTLPIVNPTMVSPPEILD